MSNLKRLISIALALVMVLSMIPAGVYAEDGTADFAPAEYTNLLIGAGSATSAGPEYPSGSIQPSPETTTKDNGGYSRGYPVVGFGQLYCQGTGGTKSYGNFLLAPMVGETIQLNDSSRATKIVSGTEIAKCYQYSATFENGISAKVTPSQNSAIYSFTYPAEEVASFLINAGRKQDNTKAMKTGSVTVDPETNTITGGGTFSGNWNPGSWDMYFALQFDTEEAEIGTYLGSTLTPQTEKTTVSITSAQEIGAYVKFAAAEEAREVKVKIAISFVSEEKALEHLNREIPAYDYDAVCSAAKEAWNEKLSAIEFETDDEELLTRLYTALYHVNVQPRDRTNDYGEWDDFYTIWDSWKTAFPLRNLLYPEEVGSIIESFVRRANAKGNGLVMSDAYIQGQEYAVGQGGNDIENIIVDAFLKDIPLPDGLTWEDVYQQAVVQSAENMRTQGYVTKGWVTSNSDKTVNGSSYSWRLQPGSATLGFAVNDIAVANMAKALGHDEDYEKYMARSQNWLNVWNYDVEGDGFYGFVQTPNADGSFNPGYNPKSTSGFYEATSWDASYLIHYDLDNLIEAMGGRQTFIQRLKWACEHSINYQNDSYAEGYLNFTNEPSMQIPWIFCTDQVKRPDLAAETINRIIGRFDAKPMDYPGDEDNGAMSSYFIFLMTGFFPYSTTNDYYLHGSRIPKVTFHLGNGNDFVITSNYTDGNIYVQSATWNGEALDVSKLTYEQIKEGGVLSFNMGSEPSDWGRMHDVTNPFAVTDLTVDEEAAKSGTASLSWTAAEDNEGGEGVAYYEIHRGTDYGFTCTDATKIGETGDTQYSDAFGQEGRYWYQVIAVDGAENKSEPAQVRVVLSLDSTAPGKVTGLTVDSNNLSYGIVTLQWDAAAEEDGVVSYRVYQGETENFTPTVDNLIGSVEGTSFTCVPSETGTYYYKVLALDGNHNASEASDAVSATIATLTEIEATPNVNHALKKTVTVNGYTNNNEAGEKAVDGSLSTKWCVKNESSGTNSPLPHWIEIDLGAPTLLSRWVVAHAGAGGEQVGYNTRDFELQYYDKTTESWVTLDSVTGNTSNVTDREFEAIVAEKVRVYITKAITSGSNPAQNARIYEIELYSPESAKDDPYYGSLMYYDGVSYAVNSQAADAEGPEKTGDGDPSTKWSARYTSADMTIEAPEGVTFDNGVSWMSVDLGRVATVESMKYLGAANENANYRTKEMYLQTSEDGENWTYVCQWVDSGDYTIPNALDYEFEEPVTSRYFRLVLPVRDGANSNARVYEWHLFGTAPQEIKVEAADCAKVTVTPENANAGETVSVEVNYTSAELGFLKLEVIGESGTPVAVTGDAAALKFSFVMPSESVTVRVYSGTTDVVAVIDLIDLIGEVTLESGDAIAAAREAYDALTGDEKENVYNYATLLTAESKYAALVSEKNAEEAKEAQAAAEAAKEAAEAAQKKAEEAQKAAEEAKAAAEAAAASAAEDKEAAEQAARQAEAAEAEAQKAEEAAKAAQEAAEKAAEAAKNSELQAAKDAQKAAEEAAKAAEEAATAAQSAEAAANAAEAAQAAQAKAEEARDAAEQAKKDAEDAAALAGENSDEAKQAASEAKAAEEAAKAAEQAAENAKAAAEAAADAAEASNLAAAKAAADAAQYAAEVAEMYNEICAMKLEMAQYLLEAQKTQLNCAKYYALMQLTRYADKNDYAEAQQAELADAIEAGTNAITAATSIEAVDKALADAKTAIDAIKTLADLEAEKLPFVDVVEDAWYYDAVKYVYNEKLFNGTGETTFSPEGTMTRAMLVTVLYRMAGEPDVSGLTTRFTDLETESYYYNAVLWATEKGITKGADETHFAPDVPVTREEMVTFLYRYAKLMDMDVTARAELTGFSDADKVSTYAVETMAWAVATKLVQGTDNNALAPQATATRAQVATILCRFLNH